MKKHHTVIMILVLTAMLAACATAGEGIDEEINPRHMYGDSWDYIIMLHSRWESDRLQALEMGMDNLYLPDGQTFPDARAGIMVFINNTAPGLDEYIRTDQENFLARYPHMIITPLETEIENSEGMDLRMYHVTSENSETQQYVAYIGNGTGFHFSMVLQLFEENSVYLEDFMTAAELSFIMEE
jgi:predicted small secreted protein